MALSPRPIDPAAAARAAAKRSAQARARAIGHQKALAAQQRARAASGTRFQFRGVQLPAEGPRQMPPPQPYAPPPTYYTPPSPPPSSSPPQTFAGDGVQVPAAQAETIPLTQKILIGVAVAGLLVKLVAR